MARATRRTGFNNNQGAINSKMTESYLAPKNPKSGDWWFDLRTYRFNRFNGSTWDEIGWAIYVSDTAPSNTNLLWLDIS